MDKMLASINTSTAMDKMLASINTSMLFSDSSLRTPLHASEIEALACSLREAADEQIIAEADELYCRVVGQTPLPTQITDGLDLSFSFGYDPYIRATLQVMCVLTVFSALVVVGAVCASNPLLTGAIFALSCAPSPATVWKVTGKAYDPPLRCW
jgi:hypothetical protein